MFSLLLNTNIPSVANAWKIWVDHIMKQKEALGYKSAAIISIKNGMTQSATSGFILPTREIQVRTYRRHKWVLSYKFHRHGNMSDMCLIARSLTST